MGKMEDGRDCSNLEMVLRLDVKHIDGALGLHRLGIIAIIIKTRKQLLQL
jgi:hypothetical protein